MKCLYAKVPAVTLIVALGTNDDEYLQESVRIANSHGISIREVSRHKLGAITGNTIHQDIDLQIPSCKYLSVEDLTGSVAKAGGPGLIICLNSITDPRNPDAVIRPVAASSSHGVVTPERHSAAVTGVVWRTSTGTAIRLPVARATNMTRSFKQFRKADYQIVRLDAGDDHTLDTYDGIAPMVAIASSEGKGFSRLVRDTCDTIVSTLIAGWVGSLNASVATGMTLSELARQRRAGGGQQRIRCPRRCHY